MKSIPGVLQRLWMYKTLANTSFMHIFLGLYLKGKSCLCSWHQCSRAWQCRRVKSRPSWTYGWRGRILRTRNRLINVCGLMWPPWFSIYTTAIFVPGRVRTLKFDVKSAWTRYIRCWRSQEKKYELLKIYMFNLLLHTYRSVCGYFAIICILRFNKSNTRATSRWDRPALIMLFARTVFSILIQKMFWISTVNPNVYALVWIPPFSFLFAYFLFY